MRSSSALLAALHATVVSCITPDIRADTNRDGVVDLTGSSDSWNKAIWTNSSGAIFLPNVGDKHSRCPNTDLNGVPLSNNELAYCHDASGHLLLAPEYAAPLRTVPMPNITEGAKAHVYATPRAAYDHIRIFILEDPSKPNATESWRLVDRQLNFNSSQLAAGLTLAIDGRDYVRETEIWDGNVLVNFDVYETPGSEDYVRDSVALKVAPVLTHHHLQKVQTLVSTFANDTDPVQEYFVAQMDAARKSTGVAEILLFNQSSDIWAQDILEPAYASMPGPDGPIAIRIMLRSAQSTRTGGRQIMEQLRGPGMGSFQPSDSAGVGFAASGFGYHTINSYGNLETIPPHRSKAGVNYPAGRIIQGKHFDTLPSAPVRNLIFSNGVQSSLFLESGWLHVGHVDEFIQFLPYDNELGFTAAFASPDEALRIIRKARDDGHGSVKLSSFDAPAQVKRFDTELDVPEYLGLTIDDALNNETFIEMNAYAQKWINHNIDLLLSEVPLDRGDILHVPALFHDDSSRGKYINEDGLDYYWPPVLKDEYQLIALLPGAINGVVVGNHYISPNPFGPAVDGQDVLAEAVRDVYGKAGMNVTFVDDFFSHHNRGGEVHCGSNTLRQTDIPWWE